ncbi:hypothetical protein [Streptomyces sp. Midd1]|uniref:hypothetical protein n=1 Tax=Streptomyces sp. Midd3 TaxID=3161191 RepID=UPI0034DAE8C4
MATYVLVENDGIDKTIKYGPLELDDPSTYTVPEGQKIMLESDARAQGYRYSEGGAALSPDDPNAGDDDTDEDDDKHGRGRHGRRGGEGNEGPQGPQGGQGAQTQPGVQGHHHQQ